MIYPSTAEIQLKFNQDLDNNSKTQNTEKIQNPWKSKIWKTTFCSIMTHISPTQNNFFHLLRIFLDSALQVRQPKKTNSYIPQLR